MKRIYLLLNCCVLLNLATGCHTSNTSAITDYSDTIVKSRHWKGIMSQSGPPYACCMDTFNRIVNDTTFHMSKPANFTINVFYPAATMRYRSTDPNAHSVRYDTVTGVGTITPFSFSLVYYYLADSAVFSYGGSTFCCGTDAFYDVRASFNTVK